MCIQHGRQHRDSPKDRPHVADTLAALVRERAQSPGTGQGLPTLKVRAPDAQAALTVLCRQPVCSYRLESAEFGLLDPSRIDLRRARLRGAQLQGADLSGARLEGANLRQAQLQGASLQYANLGRVDATSDIYKRGADLTGVQAEGAKFDGAVGLETAVFDEAHGLPDWMLRMNRAVSAVQ